MILTVLGKNKPRIGFNPLSIELRYYSKENSRILINCLTKICAVTKKKDDDSAFLPTLFLIFDRERTLEGHKSGLFSVFGITYEQIHAH